MTGAEIFGMVSSAVALPGFILSVINFRTTRRLADRTFSLTYQQDVRSWSGEVLAIYAAMERLATFPPKSGIESAVQDNLLTAQKLLSTGYLLFPSDLRDDAKLDDPSHHPLLIGVAALIVDLEAFLGRGLGRESAKPIVANQLAMDRARFVGEARRFIGTNRRFLQIVAR